MLKGMSRRGGARDACMRACRQPPNLPQHTRNPNERYEKSIFDPKEQIKPSRGKKKTNILK